MVQFMEDVRTKRVERQRTDVIIERQNVVLPLLLAFRQTRESHIKVPVDADIVCMPPFATIIESDSDDDVTPESFGDAMAQLQTWCNKWWIDQDAFFYSLLPPTTSDYDHRLELATTLFKCVGCAKPISYPRILAHECMTNLDWLHVDKNLMGVESLRRFESLGSLPYNYGGYWCEYHHKAAEISAGIVEACGMDPKTTTLSDMDEKPVRFADQCKHELFRKEKYRNFMSWRAAVRSMFLYSPFKCYAHAQMVDRTRSEEA